MCVRPIHTVVQLKPGVAKKHTRERYLHQKGLANTTANSAAEEEKYLIREMNKRHLQLLTND